MYKITAQTYQADAQSTPVDDFANSEPCEKDDLITIKADGTINITEGATSCDPPNDPITLNWSLSGNNLTVGTLGFSYNTSIIEYNCNYFKEKYIDPDDQSIIITTYTKQ